MSEVTIVVRIRAKAGCKDLLEKDLRARVAPAHAEEGCIKFAVHRDIKDTSNFLLIERWRSEADLREHLRKPYVKATLAALQRFAEEPQNDSYLQLAEGDEQKRL